MKILWWIVGAVGAFLLSFLLWRGLRALRAKLRIQKVFRFLVTPTVDEGVGYIQRQPWLLEDKVLRYIEELLERAWDKGDLYLVISGALHHQLLVYCRDKGIQTTQQLLNSHDIGTLDPTRRPGWHRAMRIMRQLITEGKASIPPEDLSEDVLEAMDQITTFLEAVVIEEEVEPLKELTRRLQQRKDQA